MSVITKGNLEVRTEIRRPPVLSLRVLEDQLGPGDAPCGVGYTMVYHKQ